MSKPFGCPVCGCTVVCEVFEALIYRSIDKRTNNYLSKSVEELDQVDDLTTCNECNKFYDENEWKEEE